MSWRLASWRVAAMPRRTASCESIITVEMSPKLPVAHGAHRREVGRQIAARTQRGHFIQKTCAIIAWKRGSRDARAERRDRCRHQRPRLQRRRHPGGYAFLAAARRSAGRWCNKLRARAGFAADRSGGCAPRQSGPAARAPHAVPAHPSRARPLVDGLDATPAKLAASGAIPRQQRTQDRASCRRPAAGSCPRRRISRDQPRRRPRRNCPAE